MKQNLRPVLHIALLVFLFILLSCASVTAQSISGTVNQYAKVTYVGQPNKDAAKIVVAGSAFAFAPNETVMLIQMKGASIINTNTAAFGTITSLNSAGYYEFGTVKSIVGDTVILNGAICHSYSVQDSVQLISVPIYPGNITITAGLTCAPWANGKGGVLVFEVADTLIMNGDIDVSTRGFLGGNVFGVSYNCGASDFATSNASLADGEKGEGIAQYIVGSEGGRAPSANGGGGAGAGNSAGGGGGNYGQGGNGGSQYSGCGTAATNINFFSYGGYSLPFTPDRLFLGGGGGGPQHDNGYTVFNGGNGGGIVVIKAGTIEGNGHAIRSNGDSVARTHDEGTSGAGAGGTIYLQCNNYTSAIQLEAQGGKGGDVFNIDFPTDCHPPSGGGGGGALWLSTASLPAVVLPLISGGAPGLVLNPLSPCYNTPYNAQQGGVGRVLYNLPNIFFNPQKQLSDTVLCYNGNLTMGLDTGFLAYAWNTGANTPIISVNQTGRYTVQATTPTGCVLKDTAIVRNDVIDLGNDTTICYNAILRLSPTPTGNFVNYMWQDGVTTSSYFLAAQTGSYAVTATSIYGCVLQDSIHVAVLIKPLLRDTLVCTDKIPVTLALPASGFKSYLWSTGSTNSGIVVTGPGTFTVHAVSSIGCILDDTTHILTDSLTLGNDTALCSNTGLILTPQPAANFTAYTWQNGDSTSTFTAFNTGTYAIKVSTIHNCVLYDSINVIIDTLPTVSFTVPDSVICEGQATLFTSHYTATGDTSITWDFGDNTFITNDPSILHAYAAPGVYKITFTGKYRLCPDTTFSKDITVNSFPTLNLGPDTSICPNGNGIVIGDYVNAGNPGAKWLWNTGDTVNQIFVTTDGRYSTTVTVNGCSTADSVDVFKNCYLDVPNGFTPNGDGVNDYFFPRQLLGRGITTFSMNIFDRWGVEIFQTTNISGRGWDGRFNNKPQPEGVYIYQIDVQFTNGDHEHYQGNVTLLK